MFELILRTVSAEIIRMRCCCSGYWFDQPHRPYLSSFCLKLSRKYFLTMTRQRIIAIHHFWRYDSINRPSLKPNFIYLIKKHCNCASVTSNYPIFRSENSWIKEFSLLWDFSFVPRRTASTILATNCVLKYESTHKIAKL